MTETVLGVRDGDATGASGLASPWWAVALLGLGYAGYVKGSPLLAFLPVDLTAAFAATCAIGLAVQVVRRRWVGSRPQLAVVMLWAVFGIGATMTIGTDRGGLKVVLLGTVTLLCALAPGHLLAGLRAQRWWLVSTVVSAAAMAGAALLMPDTAAQVRFGRLNLDGATTIGTARVMGAGVLVAVVFALTSARRRSMWWAGAALGAAALVAVGSRGPFLALLLSIGSVVVLAKVFSGARTAAVWSTVAAVAALTTAVMMSSTRPAERLAMFLTGDETDAARRFLVHEAWISVIHNPLGLGWGGFSALRAVELRFGDPSVHPHNLTLEVAAEGGWLAGAAFIVFACLSVRGYLHASGTPEAAALLGLGVYWFLVAQTSSDVNGNRMTWIALTLGLMTSALGRNPLGRPAPLNGSGQGPKKEVGRSSDQGCTSA